MRAARRAASVCPSDPFGASRAVAARGDGRFVRRLRSAADFEQLLRQRPCVISAHFAVHYLPASRGIENLASRLAVVPDLSTGPVVKVAPIVDDSSARAAPGRLGLGVVVPKRHAARAVTRSLVKREVRAAWQRRAPALAAGTWLVRLRAGFDRATFLTAASAALRKAVRLEVEQLVERCVAASAASSAS